MTDAEKALELLWDALNGFYSECRSEPMDVDKDAHGKIKKELQRAAECEKQKDEAIECAKLWMNKHREVEDKSHGLVTASMQVLDDAGYTDANGEPYVSPYRDTGQDICHQSALDLIKALAAFKVDETEGNP